MRKIIATLAMLGLVAGFWLDGAAPAHADDDEDLTWRYPIAGFTSGPEAVVFDSVAPQQRTMKIEVKEDPTPPWVGGDARFVRALTYDTTSCDYYLEDGWADPRDEDLYDFSQCDVWGSTTESSVSTVHDELETYDVRKLQFDITVPNRLSDGSLNRALEDGHYRGAGRTVLLYDLTGTHVSPYLIVGAGNYNPPITVSATRVTLEGPSTAKRGTTATLTGKVETFGDAWSGAVQTMNLEFLPDGQPRNDPEAWEWKAYVTSKSDGTFSVTTSPISESGTWSIYSSGVWGGAEEPGRDDDPEKDDATAEVHVTATGTGSLTATPTPKITGTARVGSTLTVTPGAWKPSPVTLKYQWNRNGRGIGGATASRYTLAAADRGQRITVTVTGSKANYTPVSKTSASTPAIVAGVITPATPKITGTAKKGKTLKATPGTWKPSGVTLRYQWRRDGKAITGATKTSYQLGKKDVKERITVTVTGSKSGYTSVARTSAKTGKVK